MWKARLVYDYMKSILNSEFFTLICVFKAIHSNPRIVLEANRHTASLVVVIEFRVNPHHSIPTTNNPIRRITGCGRCKYLL